jgi:hypothetical protein
MPVEAVKTSIEDKTPESWFVDSPQVPANSLELGSAEKDKTSRNEIAARMSPRSTENVVDGDIVTPVTQSHGSRDAWRSLRKVSGICRKMSDPKVRILAVSVLRVLRQIRPHKDQNLCFSTSFVRIMDRTLRHERVFLGVFGGPWRR